MPYKVPTLDEIHTQALAVRGNVQPDSDRAPGSCAPRAPTVKAGS